MNKLVRYFPETSMSAGYDRLSEIAKDGGIILRDLPPGSFVAFVNRAKTKIKLCAGGDVLAYLRLEAGRVLDPRVIQHLPEFFNGTTIEYDKAVKRTLTQQFPKWFK